jgi:hypothetical protein
MHLGASVVLRGNVTARGIIVLRRQLRSLAGALVALPPRPLRRTPLRRHPRLLWQWLIAI